MHTNTQRAWSAGLSARVVRAPSASLAEEGGIAPNEACAFTPDLEPGHALDDYDEHAPLLNMGHWRSSPAPARRRPATP